MIKKITLCTFMILLAETALAQQTTTGEGFYLGAQAGYTNQHQSSKEVQTGLIAPSTVDVSPSNTGMGGRAYAGYQFSQYGAMEMGYTYYANAVYKPPVSGLCSTPTIKESAIDLLAKGILPFCNLQLIGKAGINLMRTSYSGSLQPIGADECGTTTFKNTVHAVAGVGVGYSLSPNWNVDLTFTRSFKSSGIPDADLAALGISYHFVDKYCGQFLC